MSDPVEDPEDEPVLEVEGPVPVIVVARTGGTGSMVESVDPLERLELDIEVDHAVLPVY